MFGIDLNVILLSVFVVATVACVIGAAMHWKLTWRATLLVAVLAICAHGLFKQDAEGNLSNNLKVGIDLAGGTSLLYDVDVSDSSSPREDIRKTIENLSERVDPNGVRNLVWREEQGNRIEVQMPLPKPEVQKARAALKDLEKRISKTNMTEVEVAAAAAVDGAAFDSAVEALVRGVPEREPLLARLKAAHTTLAQAQAAFKAAADEEKKLKLVEVVTQAQADYDAALAEVMTTNLTVAKLRQVYGRPTKVGKNETESPRDRGLKELRAQYPKLTATIDEYGATYEAYEGVKGNLDDPSDLIRLLKGSGVLHFRLTASAQDGVNAAALRQQLEEGGPGSFKHQDLVWIKLDDPEKFTESAKDRLLYEQDPVAFLAGQGLIAAVYGGETYILVWNTPDRALADFEVQEGWGLTNARGAPDQYGMPAISVRLNAVGAKWMSNLTRRDNHGRNMCMVLDDAFISHATIQGSFGSVFQISRNGGFSADRLEYLVKTLNAGSLKAKLSPEPIAVRSIGSNLGADNLEKGLEAAIDALIAVMVFMLIYYLSAGLVANVALLANMLIILGVMSAYQAAFTLPGIAGVVLTIGMCVDANVLIYERIREELKRGTEFDVALRLGYQRAFSSIIDSNITNLFVCGILYMTTTTDVKGFATTLSIGICATLFTALFMTRTIFALWHKVAPIRKLSMLPLLVPAVDKALHPRINWLGKKPLFFVVSLVALVLSLSAVFSRGEELLDIEFRAGTEVEFNLAGATTEDAADDKALTLAEARARRDLIAASFTSGEGELGKALKARVAERVDQIVDEFRVRIEEDRNEARNELTIAQEALAEARAEGGDVAEAEEAVADAKEKLAEAEQKLAVSADELRADAVAATDLAGLSGATVVSVGEPKGKDDQGQPLYGAFSVVSTVADATIVSDAIKLAFEAELGDEAKASLKYDGKGAAYRQAPTFPIDKPELGKIIPLATTANVTAYRGGVAIVIDQIQPAVTIEDIENRLEAMRLQPDFEALPYRQRAAFGLTSVPGKPGLYTAVAVVAKDAALGLRSDLERWEDFAGEEWSLVDAALSRGTSLSKVSNFTPTVAETLSRQAIVAVLGSLMVIVVYIWFRFGSLRYGLAAIAALTHDVTIALGCVALSHFIFDNPFGQALLVGEFKLNLGLIAGLLTIIGYSLNDTIVLFDRIRENRGKLSVATPAIINQSINQTISRTLLTSVTTMLAVVTLYVFGGEGIRGFAFALIIGVIVGTYSSIAIASPLLALGAGKARPQPGDEAPPAEEPDPATA